MRTDRIVKEVEFLTPEQLAAGASQAVGRDGRGWCVLEGLGEQDVVSFRWQPETPISLEPFNMLSLSLDVDAPDWGLTTWLILDSRAPGMPEDDRFRCSTPGLRQVQGEFRWDQPWENFGVLGADSGRWENIRELCIDIALPSGGRAAVGPVYLVHRERPEGPRLADEELFGEELDLAAPGMEAVSAAVGAGDLAEAAQALFAAQEERLSDQEPSEPAPDFDRQTVDELMQGRIGGVELDPERPDWFSHAARTTGCFHRLYPLTPLLAAYRQTGEQRYLDRLLGYVMSWLAQNVEPTGMDDGGSGPSWNTLDTACRTGMLGRVYRALLGDPNVPNRCRLDLFKSCVAHAKHLWRWTGVANNWVIIESSVLLNSGTTFPELKDAESFRSAAAARLTCEMRRQFWPDGVCTEIAPGYHWVSARSLLGSYEKLRGSGCEPPSQEQMERTVEYGMYLARPDRTLPSLNDGYSIDGAADAAMLAYGADELGRADMLYVRTYGEAGQTPAETSHAFLDAGIYVMRSDWTRNANYLAFRGGRAGAAHWHEETGTFDLAAHGASILVDPGNVASGPGNDIECHLRSSWAANALNIDGFEHAQAKRPYAEMTASVREVNHWSSTPEADIAAMRHAGPFVRGEERITDVVHQREFHFLKAEGGPSAGEFWLLLDTVWAGGPHTANLLFHFRPMNVTIQELPLAVQTLRQKGPNLQVLPLAPPDGTRANCFCGSHDPVQGWVALDVLAPAPCVQLDVPFEGMLVLPTLLVPLLPGEEPWLGAEPQEDGGFVLTGKGRRLLLTIDAPAIGETEGRVKPVARVAAL